MTPKQMDWLKVTGVVFAIGVAWATMVGAVASKLDKVEFERYRVAQHDTIMSIYSMIEKQQRLDSLQLVEIGDFIGAECVDTRNPYKRRLLKCDRRGIK